MSGPATEQWKLDRGDDWFVRNRADLGKRDQVSRILTHFKEPCGTLLEIGCSNGWRLKQLHETMRCAVYGIDPSKLAVEEGTRGVLDLVVGTADLLPYPDRFFDIVIFGFCLFVIDPDDHFRVVAEADRVLKDGGLLIIDDYSFPRALTREYQESEKRFSIFHYDFCKLWLASPRYEIAAETIDADRLHITTALRKKHDNGFLKIEVIPAKKE